MTETADNRESWLIIAATELATILEAEGETMPPMRVSVGWPGGRGKKSTVVGQCWPSTVAEDGVAQIFMSPVRGEADTLHVLGTLLHEMIHAVDDCTSGHKGNFARIAKAVGFLPKLTSADNRSEELDAQLGEVAEKIGPFPHAAIVTGARGSEDPKKQGTRMLKVACVNGTGFIVRMTQKWIDELGLPFCACCQVEMEQPA